MAICVLKIDRADLWPYEVSERDTECGRHVVEGTFGFCMNLRGRHFQKKAL